MLTHDAREAAQVIEVLSVCLHDELIGWYATAATVAGACAPEQPVGHNVIATVMPAFTFNSFG